MIQKRLGQTCLAFVLAACLSGVPARAAVINFTGNVEQDFNSADPNHLTTEIIPVNPDANSLGQWASATGNGTWVSGWNIKDIYLSYNASTDTMSVGIDNWANAQGQIAPFGQADGNPAGTATASDPAHLGYGTAGSDKSIALVFAPVSSTNPSVPGTPVIVAGVPADKTKNGPGIDGFTVSSINTAQASGGPAYLFGTTLTANTGNLAFDPSPAHPQLEFTITNFSKIINPADGFWIEGFAGSSQDRYVGQTNLGWTKIPSYSEQNIPEPTTWLAWTLVSGAAAWRVRRSRRAHA